MKTHAAMTIILLIIVIISCDVEKVINEIADGKITAKEKLIEVMNAAKLDFATDSKLASIIGREISTEGEADILNTNSISTFIYSVQSDSLQENEFYIPVYGTSPVRSPVNLNDLLGLLQDPTAKNIMENVFGNLASLSIAPGVMYDDSPQAISKMLNETAVINFRAENVNSKIDMFLVPSKSLDPSFANSADWIVNFYTQSNSLTMWLNSATGEVKNLSEL
jgi:hypothetical protein